MMAKKLAKKKIADQTSVAAPKAGRPNMPGYGLAKSRTGLLPWKWAQDRLGKSRQYWIATTRPDGSPQVMIVWGCGWRTPSTSAPTRTHAKPETWRRIRIA